MDSPQLVAWIEERFGERRERSSRWRTLLRPELRHGPASRTNPRQCRPPVELEAAVALGGREQRRFFDHVELLRAGFVSAE